MAAWFYARFWWQECHPMDSHNWGSSVCAVCSQLVAIVVSIQSYLATASEGNRGTMPINRYRGLVL